MQIMMCSFSIDWQCFQNYNKFIYNISKQHAADLALALGIREQLVIHTTASSVIKQIEDNQQPSGQE